MTETIETLKKARELISDPAHWTQHESARDELGNPVHPSDPKAICFCTIGALRRVGRNMDDRVEAERALYAEIGGFIATFNDTHPHRDVIDAFDRTIARLAPGGTGGSPA